MDDRSLNEQLNDAAEFFMKNIREYPPRGNRSKLTAISQHELDQFERDVEIINQAILKSQRDGDSLEA